VTSVYDDDLDEVDDGDGNGDGDGAVYESFPKERKPGRGQTVLAAFVGLLLLGLVALGIVGFLYQHNVDPPGPPGDEVQLTIPLGSSTQHIGKLLDKADVISSARVFRVYSKIKGLGGFQAGQYTFRHNSSMDDAVAVLRNGPELKFERLTVPEGLTLPQIAARIGELEGRSADAFLAAARSGEVRSRYQPPSVTSVEGLLLPETYNVEPKDNEAEILKRMVDSFDATAQGLGFDAAQARVGVSTYEAMVVASLIERETKIDDERPKVAQVIYNRLRKGMRLQIDATVVYALGRSGVDTRVSLEDLKIDSPYNTYAHGGLPPTPIAAPGEASLRAAMNPEPGPWLFYVVTEPDGRHSFATTLAEHNANIRKAQAAGLR
jgi:UPF0755 protein